MAEEIGEEPDTALRWTYRKRIPEHAWARVITCAASRGKTVTIEELHAANAPTKQRGYPAHKKTRKTALRREQRMRAAS